MKALTYRFIVIVDQRGELDYAVCVTRYDWRGRGHADVTRMGKCTRPMLPRATDEFADFVLHELGKAGPGHPTLPLATD